MTVRFRLGEFRRRAGLTQREMAQSLDTTLQGYQHLEYSTSSIKFDTLDKLCHELDCAPGDLLELVPNESLPDPEGSKLA